MLAAGGPARVPALVSRECAPSHVVYGVRGPCSGEAGFATVPLGGASSTGHSKVSSASVHCGPVSRFTKETVRGARKRCRLALELVELLVADDQGERVAAPLAVPGPPGRLVLGVEVEDGVARHRVGGDGATRGDLPPAARHRGVVEVAVVQGDRDRVAAGVAEGDAVVLPRSPSS